jgi:hypothetical protein
MIDDSTLCSIGLRDIMSLLSLRNLVYNHDFRYFSNSGESDCNIPDGWLYEDKGGSASIKPSCDGLLIITSNDESSTMTLSQALHEFPRWQEILCNKTVSARIQMEIPAGCEIVVTLSDGVCKKSVTYICQSDNPHTIDISLNVANNASGLYISLQSSSNAMEISLYKIYANIGEAAIEGLACIVNGVIGTINQYIATEYAPAEELSICSNPGGVELTQDKSRLNSVLNGRFGFGENNLSLLPDMRGYFVRAWDNGAGIDPDSKDRFNLCTAGCPEGDHVGTYQCDQFKQHEHEVGYLQVTAGKETSFNSIAGLPHADLEKTSTVGGKETRAKNVYYLYTIKWA